MEDCRRTKNKENENREGQEQIIKLFIDNQIDIKEDEQQNWDDSGKDNEDSDAGIWMVETLRRRLKIGLTKRGRVNTKKVRHELLAAYVHLEGGVVWNGDGKRRKRKMNKEDRNQGSRDQRKGK